MMINAHTGSSSSLPGSGLPPFVEGINPGVQCCSPTFSEMPRVAAGVRGSLLCVFSTPGPFLGLGVLAPSGDGQDHVQQDSNSRAGLQVTAVSANGSCPWGRTWQCSTPSRPRKAQDTGGGQCLRPTVPSGVCPATPGFSQAGKERGSFEKTHHIFDVGLPSQKAVMATANVSICSSSLDPCAVCRYRGRKPANAVESTS